MSKCKPTAIKRLEGNPGKRPLNKNEPKPKTVIPNCPQWLLPEAKKEWKKIVQGLGKLGLITCVDGAALAGYCQSWARYVEAEKYLSSHSTAFETESGYMQPVPQVGIAQRYLKICQSFMSEFGLTPSSRGKMSVPKNGDDEDPLEKLIRESQYVRQN